MTYRAVVVLALATTLLPAVGAAAAVEPPLGAHTALPVASQLATPTDPVQIIKDQIDAYNRRDLEAVVATYAADALMYILPGTEPVYSGRDAIRRAYADQLERNCVASMRRECPDLRADVTSWQVLGPYVVTYQLITMVETAPPLPYVLIYEVRDGLVRRAWFLVDA